MCQGERAKFQFVFVFVMHGSFSTLKKTAYISLWEACVTSCEVT